MSRKHWSMAAAAAMVMSFALQSGIAWAIVPAGKKVTGEITSPPTATQIEVEHQLYKIQPESQAAQSIAQFHSGQIVDVALDVATSTMVVSINKHAGT
jgi:hypothetical protein